MTTIPRVGERYTTLKIILDIAWRREYKRSVVRNLLERMEIVVMAKVGDVYRVTAYAPMIIVGIVCETADNNYIDGWEMHMGQTGRLMSFHIQGRFTDGKYDSPPVEWLEPRGIVPAAPALRFPQGCVVPLSPMAALVEAIAGERLERLAAGEVL